MSAQVDELTVEQLRDAINELQKKQPYCYAPDDHGLSRYLCFDGSSAVFLRPLDTLKTIGRYIDELQSLVRDRHMSGACSTVRDVDDLTAKQLRDAMNDTRYFQRL